MAPAVQSMRLCLRAARRRVATPATTAPRPYPTIRAFSSTPFRCQPATKKDDVDELEEKIEEIDTSEEIDPVQLERALAEQRQDGDFEKARQVQERVVNNLGGTFTEAMRTPRVMLSKMFWSDEEPDSDLLSEEIDSDKFDEDDIMSLAHGKFEEFREYREYARIAAWQMPLLSKLATPFEPPTAQEPLRFRYTSYMGESHPAEKKVVVEFCPLDLPLNEAQQQKLRKLLGTRWNPETDIAKMSCEQFEQPAQNKRYLGDLVNKLVAQAKDPTDMFEDVPLDTRHRTFKVKPKFPKEWRMTEERRKFLEDTRQQILLLEQQKEEEGTLIDGVEKINTFFNPPLSTPSTLSTPPTSGYREMAHARLEQVLHAPTPQLRTRRF